jgi:hypothetical protein
MLFFPYLPEMLAKKTGCVGFALRKAQAKNRQAVFFHIHDMAKD